jgi:hypothetical protein
LSWSVSLAWSNNNQIDDKLYALINNVQDLIGHGLNCWND